MNHFEFNGKVSRIGLQTRELGHGITIEHFPDDIIDGYFEMGVVIPKKMWLEYDIQLYDYIEVEGHYITLNKNDNPKKSKLTHVVDEIIKLEHEKC